MKKLLLILLLLAPTIRATVYVDSTLGAANQAIGCSYCGVQKPSSGIGGPSIFLGMITATNTGYLDSLVYIASSNGATSKFFGLVYNGTAGAITTLLARSKDSSTQDASANLARYSVTFAPNTYTISSGSVYYGGAFTDSANTVTVRFGVSDSVSVWTGYQGAATVPANYTTAGYGLSQGILNPIHVLMYYSSGSAPTSSTTVIRSSVIRGSVIR